MSYFDMEKLKRTMPDHEESPPSKEIKMDTGEAEISWHSVSKGPDRPGTLDKFLVPMFAGKLIQTNDPLENCTPDEQFHIYRRALQQVFGVNAGQPIKEEELTFLLVEAKRSIMRESFTYGFRSCFTKMRAEQLASQPLTATEEEDEDDWLLEAAAVAEASVLHPSESGDSGIFLIIQENVLSGVKTVDVSVVSRFLEQGSAKEEILRKTRTQAQTKVESSSDLIARSVTKLKFYISELGLELPTVLCTGATGIKLQPKTLNCDQLADLVNA